ncbi:MAG TPA: NADP-dependent oxidoreductase [Acetobacteraceae bacterium]|nr:NADP-dependent oxidoreductase [Acetobacteraceae bacterium]
MKAVEVRAFGGLDAMTYADLPVPAPTDGQALIRVRAAGVGPWDEWVREGRSAIPQPLPLILGSDLSGVVEATGPGVAGLAPGDEVFGVTNPRFTGAYAELAVAEAGMIARKPARLSHVEAASVPVVATTAWQMLFEHAGVKEGQRVLVWGGAGNVGAYVVQLAHQAGADVVATASAGEAETIRALGAQEVIDGHAATFVGREGAFDAVIDTVGGDALKNSPRLIRPGGVLVSAVGQPDQALAAQHNVRACLIFVSVTTAVVDRLAAMIDSGTLRVRVGEILPLSAARIAHEMLAGKPHKPGKIVLVPGS